MAPLQRPQRRAARQRPTRSRLRRAAAPGASAGIHTLLLLAADDSNCSAYYDGLVATLNDHGRAYLVNTPLRVAHFLAQIGHESQFRPIEENGNYWPVRMREIFGCRGGPGQYDKAADDCQRGADGTPARQRPKLWTHEATYAYDPANLLSYVYASRLGNGSEASGDGFRYRGRGLIQLTGKANYQAFTDTHNEKYPGDPQDFVANPDLLMTHLKYAIESAFYYWDTRKVNAVADTDDVRAVTYQVNGGFNGLQDREARLARIKTAMGI